MSHLLRDDELPPQAASTSLSSSPIIPTLNTPVDTPDDDDDGHHTDEERTQGMAVLSSGGLGSSSLHALTDGEGEEQCSGQGHSPTKRAKRMSFRTLSKLHFRNPSGTSRRDGSHAGDAGSGGEAMGRSSADGGALGLSRGSLEAERKASSRLSSGKHTPTKQDVATGDYADFLQAEQIKAALAEEQERAIKRDIKAAKHPKRPVDGALGGRGKVQTPEEKLREGRERSTVYTPDGPTLEQRGYFPGDLRHHGHLAVRAKQPTPQQQPSRSTSFSSRQRVRPPGICGPVSDSEAESTDYTDDEGAVSPDKGKKQTSSAAASTSSTASSSSDILEPLPNASVLSLKSWQSGESGGAGSMASGGANPALARPLMELEELELDSFLKNFGRHTREVRVPSSASFPRRRLPQWEDFKVPAGEAALAASQGKRVTVLTHVDRGLQLLAASEGQGVPPGRPEPPQPSKKKRKGKPGDTSGTDEGAGAGKKPSAASLPRVTFAPEAKVQQQHQGKNSPPSPETLLAGLHSRSIEKDEKVAKKQEREDSQHGGGPLLNVHDDDTEWRPSRDEAHMEESDWELLRKESIDGEEEVQVAEDEKVDGVAWAIAYILALVERYAPEELDNSPDQTYREGKTRSHIERLYLIAPFWERLLFGLRRVYRWDNPRRTSSIMMIYFTLWYMNLLPTAFFSILIYYVCQFRFFPPSASYLHEQVRARMARGVDADRLAERLRRRSRLDVLEIYKRFVIAYGQGTQLASGDVADFHEKVKNLILWRNPQATWRTLTLLGIATVLVTFVSSHVIWKAVYLFLGFTFFILLPLQSHYPRFRRPLSPIWWALWGAPTDAQFAVQLLRRRHLERQKAKHPPPVADEKLASKTSKNINGLRNRLRGSSAAHAVAYGSMKPLNETEGGLVDLRDTKILDGQITSKPRKLGSFFCQHHGVPGHLHVSTKMLYFVALHSHVNKEGKGRKTCKTLLEDVSGLVKTKSIKLFVWSSSGLQVIRKDKGSLFFSNMPHRDNAFNLLLAVGSEVWNKV